MFKHTTSDNDTFTLEGENGKISITANSINSMAFGLNHYLKEYCNSTVTWYLRDTINIPSKLPSVPEKLTRSARVKDRFFLNYCTYGYSLNWWQWNEWERLIDWMALNGVNMALATTGQESVWQMVWRKMGLTDDEIRQFFTGPSYLAWHRMANIDSWHSPLPQHWLDQQLELQIKIIERERNLGISPIFTSFTGHVPKSLQRVYPEADITKLNAWTGFEEQYNSYYLNPTDTLFTQIQNAFMEQQQNLFGNSNIYSVDPFNELDPPSWEPDYLANTSRLIYESITKFNPEAIWLQMSWVFFHKRKDWTTDRLKPYLTAVPKEKLVLLDYYCDKVELWKQTESFYGQSFIWSYLGNFGGNTMIAGDVKDISSKLDYAYANAGENFTGIGCTLEGLDVNPMMYEYVLDRAWETQNDSEWIDKLADRHLGHVDLNFRKAWQLLYDKVYCEPSGNRASVICGRPNIQGRSKWNNTRIAYNNKDLLKVWEHMTQTPRSEEPSFRFDCVNIARQCLENYFGTLHLESLKAYKVKDQQRIDDLGATMLELIEDVDKLVTTDGYFLLGKWIADARSLGGDNAEADYYEQDARNILTTWGGRGYSLNDYANRSWSGLLNSYYKPRWESFYRQLSDAAATGQDFDQKSFDEEMYNFEWKWVNGKEKYTDKPQGDFYQIFTQLYQKYADRISKV